MDKIKNSLVWIIVFLIKGYRVLLSPFMGYHCRFHPTCSAYAETAVKRFGVFRGIFLTFSRLGRCHPWHAGGFDPVPPSHTQHKSK